jgi:hypothetical protein
MLGRVCTAVAVVFGVAAAAGWAAGRPESYDTSCPPTGRCDLPTQTFDWSHALLVGSVAAVLAGLLMAMVITRQTRRR